MSDTPVNQGAETEKGFGTGLRAQLQRRRDGESGEAKGAPEVEPRVEATARPAPEEGVVGADVQMLRAELEAARAREAALCDQLEERTQAFEQNVGSEKALAHRASALDGREGKLAEFQAELEDRERRVRDQREAIEAEHARVANLQAELAAGQSLWVGAGVVGFARRGREAAEVGG